GVHQREDADVDEPVRRDEEREGHGGAEDGRGPAEPERPQPGQSVLSRTPKSPWGRTSRIAIRSTKYEKLDQTGEISTATTASTTPSTTAAATAPPPLPSPPSTTMEGSGEIRS